MAGAARMAMWRGENGGVERWIFSRMFMPEDCLDWTSWLVFKIGSRHGWGGIWDFVDRQALLKSRLVGFGVDIYR